MKTSVFFNRTSALAGLTLVALALGGSTELWAQSIVVLLGAILILLFPPRRSPGNFPTLILLLFATVAFSAFLPADWGIPPEWRRHLAADLHAPLGDFRTPQPWLTLQSCGLVLFGIVWTGHLLAQEWTAAQKSQAVRLFASGVILLAGAVIISFLTGYRIPGWIQFQNRGWFPNRNQTADVLALAGIVTYALAFRNLGKRRWSGALWLLGLGIICAALVISYSRAGVVMLFGGVGIWNLGFLFRARGGKPLAIGMASSLMLLSLFLLFGGTTLERFLQISADDNGGAPDYRALIQKDAVRVSLQSPILGAGLGNFEPVFTSMRRVSADQNRTLHPESDWLWVAVEMGWSAPLLIVLGLYWWARACLPLGWHKGESQRRAALVAVALFILHGFVDVSGHRLGSVMVALFLAALALAPARPAPPQKWIAPIFRGLALVLVAIAMSWMASVYWESGPPTTLTLTRLKVDLDHAAAEGRLASMGETANVGLEIAPLDWTFYFRRGSAEAFRNGSLDQAANDFQIANFLEPNWIDLCLNEGEVWLAADQPDRCLDAWRETLRRAGGKTPRFYRVMLTLAANNPQVHQGLREVLQTDADCLATFLSFSSPDEAAAEVNALLARDPNLSLLDTDQRKALFSAWYARGDQEQLVKLLLAHKDWQAAGWPFLAQHYADQQDFEVATLTALTFIPAPVVHVVPAKEELASQKDHFRQFPDDLMEGVMLCIAQINGNQVDDALATIAKLEKFKDCPPYISYFKAKLFVKKKEWDQAWYALKNSGSF